MSFASLPSSSRALFGAALACAVAAPIVSIMPRVRGDHATSARRAEASVPGAVKLGDANVALAKGEAKASLGGITEAILAKPFRLVLPGDASVSLAPAQLGFAVDTQRLDALAAELEDPSSALRASLVASGASLETPISLRPGELEARLTEVKNGVDRKPKSARIDTKNGRIKADVVGFEFDAYRTMEAMLAALRAGESTATAVVREAPALHRAEDLASVRFDEVLGYFDTHYNSDAKHEARSYNLKLAASRFDGTVLFPGESFDFNEVVGPRTEAWGYKVAPVIASGELVDGVGGGTCQVAGTLHGAAFFAGLDVLERHPHTRPSYYIKMGLDAAVAYPTLTLRLRNPFEFPVVLVESVRGGVVRAEILGPKRTQSVTFVRKIDEASRFDERETPEPRLQRGTRIVSQRGVPGFKVTRFRIVREGPFAYRERLSDLYPPTSQIVRVGTGGEAADPGLHDDEHPEYVADDYLSVTQGPDIRTPNVTEPERGGGTTEVRVAGRYGTKGWSTKSGAFERRRKAAPVAEPPAAKKSGSQRGTKVGKGSR
jgi:vancomycin resistance protein YoaR